MCSGHSISGRSNTTGVLWSEMPSKIGNNLWIESPRTDAGGVMRLSSHFDLPLCGMSVFSKEMQKGRGLLYCTSSADGISKKWNVIDIDHWVKKVQRLLPSLSFCGFWPRTLVTMAQARKLKNFHSRPKKATESWRLGWQKAMGIRWRSMLSPCQGLQAPALGTSYQSC